ncbi:MAG: DUF6036 family nucleotidyltransferase [bacterium]
MVIGGSAAALRYGVTRATHDIDTWDAIRADLAAAVEEAQHTTGLPVPMATSRVADPPYEFESRLERVLPSLPRLEVYVPEKHDLVLMKTMRADEHDIQAIVEIHANFPLDLDTLVHRFKFEMDAAIGEPRRLRGNFLVVVERLSPDAVEQVARSLRQRTP